MTTDSAICSPSDPRSAVPERAAADGSDLVVNAALRHLQLTGPLSARLLVTHAGDRSETSSRHASLTAPSFVRITRVFGLERATAASSASTSAIEAAS